MKITRVCLHSFHFFSSKLFPYFVNCPSIFVLFFLAQVTPKLLDIHWEKARHEIHHRMVENLKWGTDAALLNPMFVQFSLRRLFQMLYDEPVMDLGPPFDYRLEGIAPFSGKDYYSFLSAEDQERTRMGEVVHVDTWMKDISWLEEANEIIRTTEGFTPMTARNLPWDDRYCKTIRV